MIEFEYNEVKYQVGESAKDNWDILDTASPNELWFHLNSFPSPYVIMKIDESKIKKKYQNYIKFGIQLCKEHSKYSNQKFIKTCYTQVKNVKKSDKIGEVIIKKCTII